MLARTLDEELEVAEVGARFGALLDSLGHLHATMPADLDYSRRVVRFMDEADANGLRGILALGARYPELTDRSAIGEGDVLGAFAGEGRELLDDLTCAAYLERLRRLADRLAELVDAAEASGDPERRRRVAGLWYVLTLPNPGVSALTAVANAWRAPGALGDKQMGG